VGSFIVNALGITFLPHLDLEAVAETAAGGSPVNLLAISNLV
jgi:hypothetical protein